MNRPRVYISGPITKGSRNDHFHQAAKLEEWLMQNGFAPLNPMRSITMPHAWQGEYPHGTWIDCDLPWVEVCDAVYRLPGESLGADAECWHAETHGIPVVSGKIDLLRVVRGLPKRKLVGFVGYARSGKDEAAKALLGKGWERVSFADPVRAMALAIDPVIYESNDGLDAVRLSDVVTQHGWTAAKKIPEVRRTLQRIGTEAVREIIGPTTWVDLAMKKVDASENSVVITDVRFPEEAKAIRRRGGKLIRITRKGVGPANSHVSDTGIEKLPFAERITNDGTIQQLHETTLAVCA